MDHTDYAKSRQVARRQQYKPKLDTNEARRKRGVNAEALRKNKRLGNIGKRRNFIQEEERDEDDSEVSVVNFKQVTRVDYVN